MQKKLIACYEKAEDIVAGIGLIFGVGIIFIGVIARYVFNHPLTFVDEIAPIFIVWSTLVGYSIALRGDEHVKMDILYTAIKSPGLQRLMDLFSYLCGLLFCVFTMVYGYQAMVMQRSMNRVTQILESLELSNCRRFAESLVFHLALASFPDFLQSTPI